MLSYNENMNVIDFNEYNGPVQGRIVEGRPGCPFVATIPTLTVEDISHIKSLADCFVHVSNINTTYFIDDKRRMIVVWSGPVEMNNYDADRNPLNLRSQICYDFTNNKAYYFSKSGKYRIITLTEE